MEIPQEPDDIDDDETNYIEEFFDDREDEYGKFKNIPEGRRLSGRPDLNAFLLLDRLVPEDRNMVSAAEHDEIYLQVKPHELIGVASDDDLLDLVRCRVRYDSRYELLCMFA